MLVVAAQTDRGRIRRRNEDNYLVARLEQDCAVQDASLGPVRGLVAKHDSLLLVVADGMGGEAHGDRASRIVVQHFANFARRRGHSLVAEQKAGIERALAHELEVCNGKIRQLGEENIAFRGMGTTATLVFIAHGRLHVAHVGDSRCYLHRQEQLKQLTRDHSVAQSLSDQGALTTEEACRSPYRHQLWNTLGGDAEIIVEQHSVDLVTGDKVLLCTDGLTEHVCESRLERKLSSSGDVDSICSELVGAANDAGGRDNITSILVHVPIRETKSSPVSVASSLDSAPPLGRQALSHPTMGAH